MRRIILTSIFLGALLVSSVVQGATNKIPVSAKEQAQWLRWVIPLPKKINIPAKATIPASDVRITLRKDAGEVEKTAFSQLVSLFKEKGKSDCSKGSFEILIGVCAKDA